ncbi:TDRKH [Branchiostoma lanceolatum]|uniref:TDRKH protein n=1 Tax=Branchiostoma lanceolatum TaxID=7740 RepID=A0A8J9ZDJ3_BRALA|nr:TDRKH [Branchiostoma lanceolatum]
MTLKFFLYCPKVGVMNGNQFQHWVNVSQSWAYIAAAFLIIVPLIQEIVSIRRQYVTNKSAVTDCSNEGQNMEEEDNTVGISYIEKTIQDPPPITVDIGSVKEAGGPNQEGDNQTLVKKNVTPVTQDVNRLGDVLYKIQGRSYPKLLKNTYKLLLMERLRDLGDALNHLTTSQKVALGVAVPAAMVTGYLLVKRSQGQRLEDEFEQEEAAKSMATSRQTTIEVKVPRRVVGAVIGRQGANIKQL